MSKSAKRDRQRQNRAQRREYEAAVERRRRFWRSVRGFLIILIPIAAIFLFLVLRSDSGGSDDSSSDRSRSQPADATPAKQGYAAPPPMTIDPARTYVADVATSEGSFQITLDARTAPQTVNSFVFLARDGFYDGLTFHRIVRGFVVQGGAPDSEGLGGPGYRLPDEPPPGGYRRHSVAMANKGPGTSGSQFFVVTSEAGARQLGGPPYRYSSLGTVTAGFDTVDKLDALGRPDEQPRRRVTIDSITITER